METIRLEGSRHQPPTHIVLTIQLGVFQFVFQTSIFQKGTFYKNLRSEQGSCAPRLASAKRPVTHLVLLDLATKVPRSIRDSRIFSQSQWQSVAL